MREHKRLSFGHRTGHTCHREAFLYPQCINLIILCLGDSCPSPLGNVFYFPLFIFSFCNFYQSDVKHPGLALCDSLFSLTISISLSFPREISLNLYCNASVEFFIFLQTCFNFQRLFTDSFFIAPCSLMMQYRLQYL